MALITSGCGLFANMMALITSGCGQSAGGDGRRPTAVLTRSTRGLRLALKQHGVCFRAPLALGVAAILPPEERHWRHLDLLYTI